LPGKTDSRTNGRSDRLPSVRPTANAILPEFQELKPADEIAIGGGPGWPVSSLEASRSLLFDIRQPGVIYIFIIFSILAQFFLSLLAAPIDQSPA
jgi:hypothetical protein